MLDECLHTSLVALAHDAGYVCKDWQLMATIRNGDYTFVTNNRADFASLYAREELHAGLVIVVPNVTPSHQREFFQAALSHIGKGELINIVLEVAFVDDAAICREYPYPLDTTSG